MTVLHRSGDGSLRTPARIRDYFGPHRKVYGGVPL